MKQAPSLDTNQTKKFPPWTALTAVIFIVVTYFGAQYGGAIALFLGTLAFGMSTDQAVEWLSETTVAQFANAVLVYGLMVLAVYLFIRRYKVSFRALGWVRPRFKDIAIALAGVLPYFIGYIALLSLATTVFPSIDVEQEQELGFNTTQTALGLGLTFISLVVLPPIVEEIVMRGFLFTSILKRYRPVLAVLLTSVIFGVAHLQFGSDAPLLWVAAIDTFVLSLVLCFMRLKTGSLWPGIFLHAMKNGLAFTVLFLAPYYGWNLPV